MSLLQLLIPRGWWRDLRSPTGPGVRFAVCDTCRHRHPLDARGNLDKQFADFAYKHAGHAVEMVKVRHPMQYGELLAYAPNADIKTSYVSVVTMTVTSLHSLANSATAGWESDAVDNATDKYLDAHVQVSIAAVNTAPANSKGLFILVGSSIDGGTTYTRPFDGSEGTRTFDDITTLPPCAPPLGFIPYATQNTVLNSAAMSVAGVRAHGFVLPERYVFGIINHTGFTTAASGNTVKYQPVYRTVA